MLIELPFIMSIPPRSVDEVQVVRALNKPHAPFDQTPRKQATLTKLAAVASTQVGGFSIQLERFHEFRTGQSKRIFNR